MAVAVDAPLQTMLFSFRYMAPPGFFNLLAFCNFYDYATDTGLFHQAIVDIFLPITDINYFCHCFHLLSLS